jgi:hypothetical protein
MNHNIAQIARTWVAAKILTGTPKPPPFLSPSPTGVNFSPQHHLHPSFPADLIDWETPLINTPRATELPQKNQLLSVPGKQSSQKPDTFIPMLETDYNESAIVTPMLSTTKPNPLLYYKPFSIIPYSVHKKKRPQNSPLLQTIRRATHSCRKPHIAARPHPNKNIVIFFHTNLPTSSATTSHTVCIYQHILVNYLDDDPLQTTRGRKTANQTNPGDERLADRAAPTSPTMPQTVT